MCGIVGIVGKSNVNQALYDALTVLQHRGQDAAGIVTSHDGRLFLRKDNGLVRDVFQQRHMQRLVGNMGIGHIRYPTAGSSSSAEAQPFYVNSPYGITLAHNELIEVAVQEHFVAMAQMRQAQAVIWIARAAVEAVHQHVVCVRPKSAAIAGELEGLIDGHVRQPPARLFLAPLLELQRDRARNPLVVTDDEGRRGQHARFGQRRERQHAPRLGGHRETGQDILASLLKSLRTAHLDLLPTFWVTLWGLLGDEAHGDIWPLLVNDVLLGTGDTPTEVKRSLLAAVGSVDLDTARSVRQRLFDLPAFRRRHASGAIFTVHPSRLLVLHAMMLESPLATWHGPRLQKLLLRSAPGDLLGIVVRLIGDFRRENSPLIIGLLEHTGENTLPDRLKETVTMLLADGLGMLAPRDRDQDWVVHGLEWLDRLDHEAAKPVFRRVLHDRRLLFFRAWPARCRTAVERMVQEWNNTSVT